MSDTTSFPKKFECVLGVPASRYEARPDGGVDWIVDPGPTVTFTQVEGARYRATLNGEPRPIRRSRIIFDQSEGGRNQKYDAMIEEGEAVDLEVMMTGLNFGSDQRRIARGVEMRSADNWGHFRQWNFYLTTIVWSEDGAIEVEEDLSEMDGSYY